MNYSDPKETIFFYFANDRYAQIQLSMHSQWTEKNTPLIVHIPTNFCLDWHKLKLFFVIILRSWFTKHIFFRVDFPACLKNDMFRDNCFSFYRNNHVGTIVILSSLSNFNRHYWSICWLLLSFDCIIEYMT